MRTPPISSAALRIFTARLRLRSESWKKSYDRPEMRATKYSKEKLNTNSKNNRKIRYARLRRPERERLIRVPCLGAFDYGRRIADLWPSLLTRGLGIVFRDERLEPFGRRASFSARHVPTRHAACRIRVRAPRGALA